ncbi:MAG: hypothetical protein L3K18_09650 [Thermoplasmata archaeon]|nr:hypothetical protein [Thermoplasmata archaeon]
MSDDNEAYVAFLVHDLRQKLLSAESREKGLLALLHEAVAHQGNEGSCLSTKARRFSCDWYKQAIQLFPDLDRAAIDGEGKKA